MTAVARIIDRLERVRQIAPGRWVASCPTDAHSHGDRSRGLAVRSVDDRVLIHCHAGCDAGDVVAALGLTLADLYDRPLRAHQHGYQPTHSRVPARELLELISAEVSIVAVAASDMLERRTISEADWLRLTIAAARIYRARDHVHGR